MTYSQSGLLLIDKPEGPSSAHVVHRVKRILGAKRVGHLGTLDPFASGLLPIGVNEGTKIADIFLGGAKSYCAVMVLGVATDSQDATGKVIDERPVPVLADSDLRRLEAKFSGAQTQVPPMFSALKKDGVRLYELARQGQEIERAPRSIQIDGLDLRRLSDTEIEFEVTCSRGTYVRTLAADMGAELGCGAHLKKLRRLACDNLALATAITIEQLEAAMAGGTVPLVTLAKALSHLPAVVWDSRSIARLRQGQQEVLSQLRLPAKDASLLSILDQAGELIALVQWTEDLPGARWRLYRVFHGGFGAPTGTVY
jgi:tRNA pseudouridine55 synthase